MMKTNRIPALLASLTLVALGADPMRTAAQVELGVDAGVQILGNGSDAQVLTIEFPVASVRSGFHLGERWSFEVAVAGSRVELLEPLSSETVSEVEIDVYAMYHFGSDAARTRFHVLLGVPFRRFGFSSDGFSDSSTEFGIVIGGVGVTIPVAERFALRLQSQGIGWEGSSTRLSFLGGFSAFLD